MNLADANGFTFCGEHSSKYGVVMLSKDRTVLPTLKKRAVSIMGRHGEYDFGGNTYDNRIIEVECSVYLDTPDSLRENVRKIASWLSQKGRLSFDDEPGVYYVGRLYSGIGLEQEIGTGQFSLQFDLDPFAYTDQSSVIQTITQNEHTMHVSNTGTVDTPMQIRIINNGNTTINGCTLKIKRRT